MMRTLSLTAEQEANEDPVAQPVRQGLDDRAPLRVRSDQVARLRLRRRQRVLDGVRDDVDRPCVLRRTLGGQLPEALDALAVELDRLRREVRDVPLFLRP